MSFYQQYCYYVGGIKSIHYNSNLQVRSNTFKMIERILCLSFIQFLYLSGNTVQSVGKTTGSDAQPIAIPLKNYQDMGFVGNITLGNPPQLFTMLFDSGSSDFIILRRGYKKICDRPDIRNKCLSTTFRDFDPGASTTYKKLEGKFAIEFADQSRRSGELASDILGVVNGGSRIEVKIPVGMGDVVQNDILDCDGVFGLAFNMDSSFKPSIMTPFESIVSQTDIPPRFGFYCRMEEVPSTSNTFGGELFLGGYNPDLVTSSFLTTGSVLKKKSLYYDWKIKLDGIKVGNQLVDLNGQGIDNDGKSGLTAIPDTGSFGIGAPSHVIDKIKYHIFNGSIPMDVNQQKQFFCASLPDELPPIAFVINGVPLPVGPEDYITTKMDGVVCSFRIKALEEPNNVLLGYTFLSKYYTMFDYEKKEIQFARAKQPPTNPDRLQPGRSGKTKLEQNIPPADVAALRQKLANDEVGYYTPNGSSGGQAGATGLTSLLSNGNMASMFN